MKAINIVGFIWIALGMIALFLEESPVRPEHDTRTSDRSKQH